MDNFKFNDYKLTIPYPKQPVRPDILNCRVIDLTDDEIRSLLEIKQKYSEALNAAQIARDNYAKLEAANTARFRNDLEKYYGTSGNPKADLLFLFFRQ